MLVIDRWERGELERRGWLLVYGRRKVGKTFMLKRIRHDLYITITRSGRAIISEEIVDVDDAVKEALRELKGGGIVVVDEFQRMEEHYWDLLSQPHPNGRLILSGSSLRVVSKVLGSRSPLLGLLEPFKVEIIAFHDVLLSLKPKDRDGLLWSVLLRDPWIIPMVDLKSKPEDFIGQRAEGLYMSARGLVGEVFSDEERELTKLYEAVLLLLGEGVWNLKEMAGILTSRGMIEGVSSITAVLDRLVNMGLVKKVRAWRSRGRYFYRHSSPLLSVLFYLESKYGVSDGYRPKSQAVSSVLGRELEQSVGELLAAWHGGELAYHRSPEGDLDVVVLRGKKVLAAYEVKASQPSESEVKRKLAYAEKMGLNLRFVGPGGDLDLEDLLRISSSLRHSRIS